MAPICDPHDVSTARAELLLSIEHKLVTSVTVRFSFLLRVLKGHLVTSVYVASPKRRGQMCP